MLALAAKSLIAVMLLVAGGAKLADPASFAAAVRLFVSFRVPRLIIPSIAVGVALAEIALGVASLSWPAVGWLNPVVFALVCGFVAVSGAGYVFHRGMSCRCFGALSRRKFDAMGVLRSIAIAAVAAAALRMVPPALVHVGVAGHLLLLLAGLMVALAAFTAAGSLAVGRRLGVEMR